MFNGFKVIDAHCHIYPDKIVDKATEATSKFYDIPFACRGDVADLKNEVEKAGVDISLVQSVATTPRQVESINEFIARTVNNDPKRMFGLGTLHPDSSDLRGDINKIKELGLKGVKLHPDIQQFKIDDYRCLKIYEICEEEELPVLMHTGDSRYDYSNPNRLLPVMQIFTGLTVIGAHLGGYSVWDDAVKNLRGLDNLYFDCSSSFFKLGPEKTRDIIMLYSTDKVLFGSDFPMWSPEKELEMFFEMGFSRDDNKKMLSENAIKIFKL